MSSPESGTLEKTALPEVLNRDFLNRVFNSFFNPLAREDILAPPNSTAQSRMLYHAGTLSLGYGGLGLVLRKMVRAQQKNETRKTVQKLRAFSAARNPTLSIDPYLDDEEQEKELENLGIPELPSLKAAGTDAGLPDKYAFDLETTPYLALTAAAVIASGYGGWRLSDYLEDRKREEKLDKGILKTKNMIDKMIFDEIERVRGPQKAAALSAVCQCLEKESQRNLSLDDLYKAHPGAPPAKDYAGGEHIFAWTTGFGNLLIHPLRAMETSWWVWAAATFAVSYAAAKRFGDKADPNRQRLKEVEDIAKERAKVTDAPVLLDESSLTPVPSVSTESSNLRATAAVPVQGVKTKTPVDATDPYASILQ